MALLISNQDIEQVLDMKTCLDAIEEGVKEYYRGDATCRPRIDVWAPSGDPEGYYQWGSMEGTSRRDGEEILGLGGNQIQGIQFASAGGAIYRLIKDRGLGRAFPTDWLLPDIRN